MIEVWTVLDGAVQTAAIFSTKDAAEEYATVHGADLIVHRDWLFETVEEAKLRDYGWAHGDLNWHEALS